MVFGQLGAADKLLNQLIQMGLLAAGQVAVVAPPHGGVGAEAAGFEDFGGGGFGRSLEAGWFLLLDHHFFGNLWGSGRGDLPTTEQL